MKSIFKRSAISLIVLGMAGSTYAAALSNNTTWSPRLTGVFIGVDALDLRPMNGDLDYVTVSSTSPSGSFYTRTISTDYDWSWRLYGGIKFTDNDDITLSWMRIRTSDKDSVGINTGTAPFPRWWFPGAWDAVSSRVKFDLDQVYGVWGHTINFNNPWSVRYAAGIEYAKLDSDMTVSAQQYSESSYDLISYTAGSRLSGWGPRVEFDMTYHLPYNFALFGKANAALLVSDRKISLEPYYAYDEYEQFSGGTSHFSTRHVVVPRFGMRLGASYTAMFGQAGAEGGSCTTLTIDAGWQVESYVHAIERPNSATAVVSDVTSLANYSNFASTKTSNFGDQGLFLGVKLGMDWL
ncbi:MAG: hypothetical protein KIT56_04760 [Gammaproteobacteria bacterium]|nr:hypothetical protein [Gammaproteobacteria bacterium]MCW5583188.1 hypothetical protein [Gammaproteobacteria bacterium]